VMDVKWAMLDAMESQVYEWLPWLHGVLDEVPADADARRAWLETTWAPRFREYTEAAMPGIEHCYGGTARNCTYAEAFEICEYGRRPSDDDIRTLFPFFPE